MATYTGTDSDAPFPATIQLEDAAGNPVAPDDIPVWETSDATIATVSSTTPDGTQATIAVAGRAGSCTITATSVNKTGTKIVMSGAVVIAAGDASQGEITFPSTETVPSVPASDPTSPSASATPGDSAPVGAAGSGSVDPNALAVTGGATGGQTGPNPGSAPVNVPQSATTPPAASTVGAS